MEAALQRRADGLAPLTDETQARPGTAPGRAVPWVGVVVAAAIGLVAVGQALRVVPAAVVAGAAGLLTLVLAGAAAIRALRAFGAGVEARARQLERRRIARELHDGLAQELAFISMQAHRLAVAQRDGRARDIADAAARAVEESRQVITELARASDEPFEKQLEQVTRRLAERAGATLRVEMDPGCSVTPAHRADLLRIAGEAVNNGVRHGGATEIELGLRARDGLRLTIRDNGAGFKSGVSSRGFGLLSMRERATAIGGELRVRSQPGRGAEIEVTVP